jgi:hypothetical protein
MINILPLRLMGSQLLLERPKGLIKKHAIIVSLKVMSSLTKLMSIFALICSLLIGGHFNSAYAQPTFKDSNIKAELVVAEGLVFTNQYGICR